MKRILITAYAVNPYKGSEDGTAWNWVKQISKYNKVLAITRKNNRPDIEKFEQENPTEVNGNITWIYFDLPVWMRFWKKGGRGALLYFYMWQFFMPAFIKMQKLDFDLAHNLNFHNDWTPSFLWILKKPFVWGPIGHHPEIPKDYLYKKDKNARLGIKNLKWKVKSLFWKFDPFLKICKSKADHIIAINSSVQEVLKVDKAKIALIPAVGTEIVPENLNAYGTKKIFNVLSIGRFVPLKGFDICIRSFAKFVGSLLVDERKNMKLSLVGKGPLLNELKSLAKELEVAENIEFIEWMPRKELEKVYRLSEVFLFPSHEGAGMVVPEALSYGIPVLCFDNCGPGELIDLTCGIRVPYSKYDDTVEEFANNLNKLYKDPDLREKMSRAAYKRTTEHFDWEVKGVLMQNVYEKVLKDVNEPSLSISPELVEG